MSGETKDSLTDYWSSNHPSVREIQRSALRTTFMNTIADQWNPNNNYRYSVTPNALKKSGSKQSSKQKRDSAARQISNPQYQTVFKGQGKNAVNKAAAKNRAAEKAQKGKKSAKSASKNTKKYQNRNGSTYSNVMGAAGNRRNNNKKKKNSVISNAKKTAKKVFKSVKKLFR